MNVEMFIFAIQQQATAAANAQVESVLNIIKQL